MSSVKPSQAVDTHAHVFSATAAAVPGARYRPDYGAEPSQWRREWAAAGITHGVAVQPSFFGFDNRELLDTVASDRAHLRGVAVLNPLADASTLARFDAAGVRAIRLNLKGVPDYTEFASRAWCDLYARVHKLGWHVEVYCDTGRLPEVVAAFDGGDANLVFDHFGNPGLDPRSVDRTFEAVAKLGEAREVWCKLSGPYRLGGADPAALARRWIETVGGDRLVWGSDWPWTAHEQAMTYLRLREELDAWVGPELVPAVLWDNPARLYGFRK
jgi:predicted TIM-barrel fold metal-dependent hydrolase